MVNFLTLAVFGEIRLQREDQRRHVDFRRGFPTESLAKFSRNVQRIGLGDRRALGVEIDEDLFAVVKLGLPGNGQFVQHVAAQVAGAAVGAVEPLAIPFARLIPPVMKSDADFGHPTRTLHVPASRIGAEESLDPL